MTDNALITELELIGAKAWPALVTTKLFGWLLRADKGITRRANSVLPVAFTGKNLDSLIDEVEAFYTRRNLPVYFQMTEASQPPELDDTLQDRGFERELEVHVQTGDVDTIANSVPDVQAKVLSEPDDAWVSCYSKATGYDSDNISTRLAIMARAQNHRAYSLALIDDEPAAVGFGVVTDQWLGLFGIATRPEFRRRGAARAVNAALADWGKGLGATKAYLQVEVDNDPAIELYQHVGFETLYTYWYRLLKE